MLLELGNAQKKKISIKQTKQTNITWQNVENIMKHKTNKDTIYTETHIYMYEKSLDIDKKTSSFQPNTKHW